MSYPNPRIHPSDAGGPVPGGFPAALPGSHVLVPSPGAAATSAVLAADMQQCGDRLCVPFPAPHLLRSHLPSIRAFHEMTSALRAGMPPSPCLPWQTPRSSSDGTSVRALAGVELVRKLENDWARFKTSLLDASSSPLAPPVADGARTAEEMAAEAQQLRAQANALNDIRLYLIQKLHRTAADLAASGGSSAAALSTLSSTTMISSASSVPGNPDG